MKRLLIASTALVLTAASVVAQSDAPQTAPATDAPATEQPAKPAMPRDGQGRGQGMGPHGKDGYRGHGGQGGPQYGGMPMMPMMPQGFVMVPGYVMVPAMPGMMPQGPQGHEFEGERPDRGGYHQPKGGHGDWGDRGDRANRMRAPMFGALMEDGQITREEFDAKADVIFQRLDLDGDGIVTREELPARGALAKRLMSPVEAAPSDE